MLMNTINPTRAISHWLTSYLCLESYEKIITLAPKVDVSTDQEFQRTFNGFYRVRRNEDWRRVYYTIFERKKSEYATFEDILYELYEKTGRVEASFASKMLATLEPEAPIWDSHVVRNLEIDVPVGNRRKELDRIVDCYEQIENWYGDYLKTENARECIRRFDEVLPDYAWLTDVKKIDFFLWRI